MRAFWWQKNNFGDTLTPFVLEAFLGETPELALPGEAGKIVAIGSIVYYAVPGDVVWGAGTNRAGTIDGKGIKYLAVRGPLTRSMIKGAVCPQVYGDPALLLPLMYSPQIEKKYHRGILPHYVDKGLEPVLEDDELLIDIQAPWKEVIDAILSCDEIVSSSLHGIIAAEAYGIPATWAVWSDKIRGGELKFHDYFLGTGRAAHKPGEQLPPIVGLSTIQQRLLTRLMEWRTTYQLKHSA